MTLTYTRIIARQSAAAGGTDVLAQRHEVMWRDSTTAQLHPVLRSGMPQLLHRAVELGNTLALVNLNRLVPTLDADMRRAPMRDHVGTVFMALRLAYCSADDFLAAVRQASSGAWQMVGDGWVWQARPAQVDATRLDAASTAVLADLAAVRRGPFGTPARAAAAL